MRARDFLIEYNRAKTEQLLGDKLTVRYRGDDGMPVAGFEPEGGWEPEDENMVLDYLETVDPTPKNAFVLDLARWYLDGSMQRLEDAEKATEPLKLYSKFRNRGLPVLRTLTFGQFLDLGDELGEMHSQSDTGRAEEQGFYDREEAFLMVNNDRYKVIMPHTMAAAQYFGRGTRWCTASESNNQFDYYNGRGRLYIVLFKGQKKKWQLHCEAEQFMDERDEKILRDDWFAEEEFVEWFAKKALNAHMVKNGPFLLEYYPNPDSMQESAKLYQIGRNPWALKYFKDPTDTMVVKMIQCGKATVVKTILAALPRNDIRVTAEKTAVDEYGPTFYFEIEDPMWDTKEWFDGYLRNWFMFRVGIDYYESIVQQHPDVARYAIVNDLLSGDNERALEAACASSLPNFDSAKYARDNKRKRAA